MPTQSSQVTNDYSTSANQATEIATLASIDAGIPVSLGQKTSANSMPVVLPSDYQLPVVNQIVNSPFYVDMNASTGGVARDTQISTAYMNVYSYTGSGLFYGFRITFESLSVSGIRVVIDGIDYFMGSTGMLMSDVVASNLYNLTSTVGVLGVEYDGNSFTFQPPAPLKFTTSIVIKASTVTGNTKKFRAGFAIRSN